MEEKLAELIGILLGDGSVSIYQRNDRPGKQYRVKVTLNSEKDRVYADYVSTLFREVFGECPNRYYRKGEKTLDLIIRKRKVVQSLLDCGMTTSPKWRRACIPKKFMEKRLARFVLRGYMDTDGCITVFDNNGTLYPRIEMKVCPSPMQKQIVFSIKSMGLEPRINRMDKGKIRIMVAGKKKLEMWNSRIGFSNPRNGKIAEKIIAGSGIPTHVHSVEQEIFEPPISGL